MVRVGDLFCGAGGFSTGVEEIGWDVAWGIDNTKAAVETWGQNHSGESYCMDIADVDTKQFVQNELPSVDVLIGGPPCKDFSKSNQVIDKGRNNLVLVFMEYVKALEPDAFIIENVRQLETQYEGILEEIYESGSSYGYAVNHRTLNAADYGVPQDRVRTFIIGVRTQDTPPAFPCPTHGEKSPQEQPHITAVEALKDIVPPADEATLEPTTKYKDAIPEIPPGLNYSYYTERLGHPEPKFEWRSRFSDFLYKANPDDTVRTIKAKPGASTGPFHWNNRRFSINEKAALQSFPDSFSWPNARTTAQELVGNAVPPNLARAVADAVNMQAFNGSLQYIPRLLHEEESLDIIARRRTATETYKAMAEQQINSIYGDSGGTTE